MVLIARSLGPEGQGMYSLLASVPKLLFNFFSFGAPTAMIFYLGRYKTEQEQGELKSLILTGYIFCAFVAISLGSVFAFLSRDSIFSGIDMGLVYLAVFSCVIWFCISFSGVLLQSKQMFKHLSVNQISQSILFLILVGLATIIGETSLALFLIFFLLTFLFNFILDLSVIGRKKLFVVKKNQISREKIKEIYKFSFKSYLGSIADFLMYRVDMYIIAFFLPKSLLGVYVIAVNLVERIWLFPESISKVLFAKLVNEKSDERRDIISIYTLKISFYITVLVSLGLVLFSHLFISLFFGPEYIKAVKYVYILVPGVVCQGMGIICKRILEARGYPGTNAKSSISTLSLNIVLNILLIPKLGVEGAAISSLISYTIYCLFQGIRLKQKFQIKLRKAILLKSKDIKIILDFIKTRKINI